MSNEQDVLAEEAAEAAWRVMVREVRRTAERFEDQRPPPHHDLVRCAAKLLDEIAATVRDYWPMTWRRYCRDAEIDPPEHLFQAIREIQS